MLAVLAAAKRVTSVEDEAAGLDCLNSNPGSATTPDQLRHLPRGLTQAMQEADRLAHADQSLGCATQTDVGQWTIQNFHPRAGKLKPIAYSLHGSVEALLDLRLSRALDLDAVRPDSLDGGMRRFQGEPKAPIDPPDFAVQVKQADMQPGRRLYHHAIHGVPLPFSLESLSQETYCS